MRGPETEDSLSWLHWASGFWKLRIKFAIHLYQYKDLIQIYFWNLIFSLALFNPSINDFPLSWLLLILFCHNVFFFPKELCICVPAKNNTFQMFPWGKFKEGRIYRSVVRVHGTNNSGKLSTTPSLTGKMKEVELWSMKNFRPKQAPRHPYLRFRGGASQLTAGNTKLIGKGLWVLQFIGDKA